MSTLLTRDRNTQPLGLLEPFRLMRDLWKWDPQSAWPPAFEASDAFSPSFEVKETLGAYLFKADLPGIKEEDLEINVLGNRLTVSGRREMEKEEQGETFHVMERRYGSFSRTFALPEEVPPDHVHAELKQGELVITIPKRPESKPSKVRLQK